MNVHKLPLPDTETSAVDALEEGGADLMPPLSDFKKTKRAFKNLRRGMFGLHDTLIRRARFHRRTETQLRKLAASLIEAVK